MPARRIARAPAWPVSRIFRAVGTGAFLISIGNGAGDIWYLYGDAVTTTRQRLDSFSAIFAEETGRAMNTIDRTGATVQDTLISRAQAEEFDDCNPEAEEDRRICVGIDGGGSRPDWTAIIT